MPTVLAILGWAHWAGFLMIVVGYVMGLQSREIHPVMLWGARLQLLIGLGLVGVLGAMHAEVNYGLVGLKLLLSLGVVALSEISARRSKPLFMHLALALTVVAAAVGYVWL